MLELPSQTQRPGQGRARSLGAGPPTPSAELLPGPPSFPGGEEAKPRQRKPGSEPSLGNSVTRGLNLPLSFSRRPVPGNLGVGRASPREGHLLVERKELRQGPARRGAEGLTKTRAVLIKCPKCLSYLQWGGCLANVNDKKYILMAHDAAATVGHGRRKRLWGQNYRVLVPGLRAECPGLLASLPRHPQGLGGCLGPPVFLRPWYCELQPMTALPCPGCGLPGVGLKAGCIRVFSASAL